MKLAKRIFVGLGILVLICIIGAIFIASVFEKRIGETLIQEINKELTTELQVADFDLSLIADFPQASVAFYDVILEDALGGVLLEAKELSFRFGVMSLFGSDLKFHSIVVENGSLKIKVDMRGRANYEITQSLPVAANANATL